MGDNSNSTATTTQSHGLSSGHRTVSLKLFASWEIDKTSSSCIPRLCMFGVTGVQASHELFDDDAKRNVIIAVQMVGSKRILRSGEISLLRDVTETPLDITFSMQYAHFLKRDVNNLQVALQRRNKYKNRTLIGYKTLAMGIIDLSQVLQQPKDLDLDLYNKENKIVAVITLQNITSKPVSYEVDNKGASLSGADPSPESDDEEDDMMDDDLSLDELCSDDEVPRIREQTNFKQKIARLLRRFKSSDVAEKHILTVLERQESAEGAPSSSNLDELFDELEDLSDDSENEQDNVSVRSLRRPTLTQYFDSSETTSVDTMRRPSKSDRESSLSRSMFSSNTGEAGILSPLQDAHSVTPYILDDVFTTSETTAASGADHVTSPESAVDSLQLGEVFKDSTHSLPEVLYLVDESGGNSYYPVAHLIYQIVNSSSGQTALRIAEKKELREFIRHMSLAIQSYWTNNSSSTSIKVLLIGGDNFFNQTLDEFTKTFSGKSSDCLNYVKFLPVPLCRSNVSKQLSHLDTFYHQLFSRHSGWHKLNEKALQSTFVSGDCSELLDRICKYEEGVSSILQYPISEAMIALSSTDDKNDSQEFIPFLTNVLIGSITSNHQISTQTAVSGCSDGEESSALSSSPAASHSHAVAADKASPSSSSSPPGSGSAEPCELQIEYWLPAKSGDKTKSAGSKETKETLKGFFKYIQVIREKSSFRLIAVTREKRGKMIRIGKKSKDRSKEKEADTKSQNINRDGITRIVCTTKDSAETLLVHIDEVEHCGVRFFQLSTHWQSHVKYLPIAVSKSVQTLDY